MPRAGCSLPAPPTEEASAPAAAAETRALLGLPAGSSAPRRLGGSAHRGPEDTIQRKDASRSLQLPHTRLFVKPQAQPRHTEHKGKAQAAQGSRASPASTGPIPPLPQVPLRCGGPSLLLAVPRLGNRADPQGQSHTTAQQPGRAASGPGARAVPGNSCSSTARRLPTALSSGLHSMEARAWPSADHPAAPQWQVLLRPGGQHSSYGWEMVTTSGPECTDKRQRQPLSAQSQAGREHPVHGEGTQLPRLGAAQGSRGAGVAQPAGP